MPEPELFESPSTGMKALWHAGAHEGRDRAAVYLHGAGGFGRGIEALYEYPDFPSVLKRRKSLPYDFIVPSCDCAGEWQPELLRAFLEDVSAARGMPPEGYDLIGYSRGGRGVYRFVAEYPGLVRAAVVISSKAIAELAEKLKDVPVLIIHGVEDQVTQVSEARDFAAQLQAIGGQVEFLEKNGDHFIVGELASDPMIYAWLDVPRA